LYGDRVSVMFADEFVRRRTGRGEDLRARGDRSDLRRRLRDEERRLFFGPNSLPPIRLASFVTSSLAEVVCWQFSLWPGLEVVRPVPSGAIVVDLGRCDDIPA